MQVRPKIKPTLKPVDKWLEALSWVVLAFLWFVAVWNYDSLPETIPTHFNAGGEPDVWGGKAMILTLPGIASLLFLLLTILTRFPYKFNYPLEITAENAAYQYANAIRMMRILKLSVVLIFLLILIMTIRTATGKAEGLGWWFILVVLGLAVGPLVYFLNRAYRKTTSGPG
jgi:uncharacterized membrane protein